MSYIYALYDSSVPDVWRYIGKTNSSPRKRLAQHLKTRELGRSDYKATWMRSVISSGAEVCVATVEECADDCVNDREIYWIAKLRADGVKLTNHKTGGDGGAHSDDTKQKLSKWRTGKKFGPMSEKAKAGISRAKLGKPLSDAQKAGLSLAKTGIKLGPRTSEDKARIAEGQAKRHGKLDSVKVEQIFLAAIHRDKPQSQIAKDYGVDTSSVERIVAGKTWAHLNLRERFSPCC